MRGLKIILGQLDDAWGHAWESVSVVLAGVGEDEAAWQAEAYADVDAEAGWPAPGTIHWQVAHLAANKVEYASHVRRALDSAEAVVETYTASATFTEAVAALSEAHAALRSAIEALTPEALASEGNHGMPLVEYLAMVIRHDTWHAGQIAVLRRFYRGQVEQA
jgi:uncharacterized damage-inducible protein DinB